MNRYPLNSRTLGSGISVPESYWAATINVVVTTALDNFVVLTGVLFQSSVIIQTITATGFIRSAAMAASAVIQMVPAVALTRVTRMVSAVSVAVVPTVTAIAGLLQIVTSYVTTGVNASVNATAKRFLVSAQNIQESTSAFFGKMQLWVSAQNVVESATINFTSFGDYAPSERHIIVQQEDRDAEVS